MQFFLIDVIYINYLPIYRIFTHFSWYFLVSGGIFQSQLVRGEGVFANRYECQQTLLSFLMPYVCSDDDTSEELYRIVNKDSLFFERIIGISEKLDSFRSDLSPIQKFLLNYVKQFESIITFIRATRDRQIDLHSEALETLIKYFLTHNHLNQARLLPFHLATM